MAVPFRKVSKTRKRMRRSHNALCPNCKTAIKAHRVCPKCGMYKGKQVIKKEENTKDAK